MVSCAPLIVAQELGFFTRRGIHVRLTREVGLATLREKLIHEELHAIAAPSTMAFAIHCGLGVVARHCLTAICLAQSRSAITLSKELRQLGVSDVSSLKTFIEQERGRRVLAIGSDVEFSTQSLTLRRWLHAGGIDPERNVRMPVVPSALAHRRMLEGQLDGYCASEPWNTISEANGSGWIAATFSGSVPHMQGDILLVLENFARAREEEHLALVGALIEANRFCSAPENRSDVARMLSQICYDDVPEEVITSVLDRNPGPDCTGNARPNPLSLLHHRDGKPDRAMARSILKELRTYSTARSSRALRPEVIPRIFREDIYNLAAQHTSNRSNVPSVSSRHLHSSGPPGELSYS